MNLHKFALAGRRHLRQSRMLQIVLLCLFWLAGETAMRLSGLPVPGGIAGMFLALGLLASRSLSLGCMRRGANWFLAEMLLFFIPAVLAVLDHREFLGLLGLKVLAVILLGTVIVMSVTALSVDLCCRLNLSLGGRVHAAK